jgi:metallo-beta-lactamase class B
MYRSHHRSRPLGTTVAALAFAVTVPVAAQNPDSVARAAECKRCAEFNVPHAPVKIYGNTYWVGTATVGSILITSDQGHILIDGVLPESAPQILANIRALGFRSGDVKLILNSHTHYDHAGGIEPLRRATGAEVAASDASARDLERGGPGPSDPQLGVLVRFPAVLSVRRVTDGEVVHVGPLSVKAHYTAGHTPGGTTWTWRSCERDTCRDIVYADSQTPVSDDTFLFTQPTRYPSVVSDFQHGFAVLDGLSCDILITPHPGASGMWERIAARDRGDPHALVNRDACKQLAANGRRDLDARLARERSKK